MKAPTLKNDDTVKIPAAVAAAAARSEELHRQMNPKPEENTEGENNTDGEAKVEPVTPEGNLAAPVEPKPAEPAPKQDAKPAEPVQKQEPKGDDGESWEHKYKSLHGRYTRQSDALKQLTEQVQSLQGVIATMQAAPRPKSDEKPTEVTPAESLLTPDEIDDYGADLLKVVGKKAREELAPVFKAYEDKIKTLEERLNGVSTVTVQSQYDRMKATMDEKLPQWRELNRDERFLDWLGLPDPFSGAIRHDMLKAAYTQGDANRVLAFFNGFLAQEAAVAPANAEPETGVTKAPKVPLADLAAPGRAKTAASASTPAEKPVITRGQISQFYADVAAGKYRGRDADKKATEDQIFAAQREGRIR